MKLTRAFSLCLALAVTPFVGVASAASEPGDQLKQKLSDTLGIEVISMADSPIPGLYQAITNAACSMSVKMVPSCCMATSMI